MATTRTANRPIVSWLFIVSGVVFLLGVLFSYVAKSASGTWVPFLAELALGIALLLLFLGKTASLVLRAAYIVAAIGWILLAISAIASLGSAVTTIAIYLALIGTLVAGVVGFMRHVWGRNSDLAFLIASILIALTLIDRLHGFLGGTLTTIITVLFAALLVVTGYFLLRRRR